MRNLINFLIKYNHWFLFLLLEVICFTLLFRFNYYHQSAYFTSANVITGKIYELSGNTASYFHLRTINDDLLDRNVLLEQQIANLENALASLGTDSTELAGLKTIHENNYTIFKANAVNNSLNNVDNYITIDKGSSDGIQPDMGDRKSVV